MIKDANGFGYIRDTGLSTKNYKIEEVSSFPFEGMIYRLRIDTLISCQYLNLGSGPLDHSGIPGTERLSVDALLCNGKEFIILSKNLRTVARYDEWEILSLIDISDYPKNSEGRFIISREPTSIINMEMHCLTKEHQVIPIVYFSVGQAKKSEDKDGTIYKGGIKLSWIYDIKTKSLKSVSLQGAYCFEPNIAHYSG